MHCLCLHIKVKVNIHQQPAKQHFTWHKLVQHTYYTHCQSADHTRIQYSRRHTLIPTQHRQAHWQELWRNQPRCTTSFAFSVQCTKTFAFSELGSRVQAHCWPCRQQASTRAQAASPFQAADFGHTRMHKNKELAHIVHAKSASHYLLGMLPTGVEAGAGGPSSLSRA